MATARRRSDDPDDSDKSHLRSRSPFNGHTKWVVSVVSAGLISALAWLVVNDRNGIDRRFEALERRSDAIERLASDAHAAQRAHEAKATQQWEELTRRLAAIDSTLKEISREVKQ